MLRANVENDKARKYKLDLIECVGEDRVTALPPTKSDNRDGCGFMTFQRDQ